MSKIIRLPYGFALTLNELARSRETIVFIDGFISWPALPPQGPITLACNSQPARPPACICPAVRVTFPPPAELASCPTHSPISVRRQRFLGFNEVLRHLGCLGSSMHELAVLYVRAGPACDACAVRN